MRPRSSCGAAFRDGSPNGKCSVIGKVLRGTNAARLLYYLYGPGKANEHTDPHLVAGFCDPADLEPEGRRGGSPGRPPAGGAPGPAPRRAARAPARAARVG